jgi:Ca2+-transporting ATPase
VYWPPLAAVLSVVPPGFNGWLLIVGASLVPLVGGQAYLAWPGRPGLVSHQIIEHHTVT